MRLTKLQEQCIQALEVGDFEQGRELLVGPNEDDSGLCYCPLGVWACVCGVSVHTDDDTDPYPYFEFEGDAYHEDDKELPLTVYDKLGLQSGFGHFWNDFEIQNGDLPVHSITGLNDQLGWSFKKIAAFIREKPERIFKTLP